MLELDKNLDSGMLVKGKSRGEGGVRSWGGDLTSHSPLTIARRQGEITAESSPPLCKVAEIAQHLTLPSGLGSIGLASR